MLDGLIRKNAGPVLDRWAGRILQSGLTANKLTLIGCLFGFIACFCAAMQVYLLALLLILLNRLMAAMAGSVARITAITALGSYLDLVCDFFVFGAFAFFFSLGFTNTSLAAAFLIFSYLVMIVAYLGQTTFAARADILDLPQGGLVEKTEMTVFMLLCCLMPPLFAAFAPLFALLCWTAAVWRILTTIRLLKK